MLAGQVYALCNLHYKCSHGPTSRLKVSYIVGMSPFLRTGVAKPHSTSLQAPAGKEHWTPCFSLMIGILCSSWPGTWSLATR